MNNDNLTHSYIDQLTWLRGIAAFFVIVCHSIRATEVQYSDSDEVSDIFLISLFDLGSFGVMIFFVLSGCTLYISNANKMCYSNVYSFYVKRFFRIWPAFVISMVFYICFRGVFDKLYINPQGHWVEGQFLNEFSLYDVISHVTLTFNISGTEGLFNNAYWSLPVEFQYYLIFPIIIASIKYMGLLGPICIGGALFLLPKLNLVGFESNLVFNIAYGFCGGVLIGYVYTKSSLRMGMYLGTVLAILITLFTSVIAHSWIELPDFPLISDLWNWYVVNAIILVYIVLITRFDIPKNIARFLKHYGTISYSTYLYHNLFIAIAILFIVNFEIDDGDIKLLLTLLFTLFATYLVSIFSYKYVEKPFVAIGRRIAHKESR